MHAHARTHACIRTHTQDIGWIPIWNATKWPSLVQTVLGYALEATNAIETGGNVMLVGDEHGDSDCLVASVALITIDAHYRTRAGFEELVQREWLAMGFAFSDRCRHAQGKMGNRTQPSGCVLLFLDAISQLIRTKHCPTGISVTRGPWWVVLRPSRNEVWGTPHQNLLSVR